MQLLALVVTDIGEGAAFSGDSVAIGSCGSVVEKATKVLDISESCEN